MSEQPSITTWVPKWEPWDAKPKTLADCQDGVPVIVSHGHFSGTLILEKRFNELWHWNNGGILPAYSRASEYKFIRYLDHQPEQPLTLEQVPDGRVVKSIENRHLYWKHSGIWLCAGSGLATVEPSAFGGPCTITNWVMELVTHNPQ